MQPRDVRDSRVFHLAEALSSAFHDVVFFFAQGHGVGSVFNL